MQNLTTIHLMRHGEVDNPDGVLYGRLPGYHLTDLGKQMAQMSAEYL
ncbi:MAG: histidine phosphatase family protein, partial [Varibaculum sp.]